MGSHVGIGDLVRVTSSVSALGLNGEIGFIIEHYPELNTESYQKDGPRAIKVLFPESGITRSMLIDAVDVISKV